MGLTEYPPVATVLTTTTVGIAGFGSNLQKTMTPEQITSVGLGIAGNLLFLAAAYAGYRYGRAVERQRQRQRYP